MFLDRRRIQQKLPDMDLESMVGKMCALWFQYDNFNRQLTWKFFAFTEHVDKVSNLVLIFQKIFEPLAVFLQLHCLVLGLF